ncbi:MAG: Phosphatidylserine/phosphatidylglycerophosphate/ cardiolipin synthase-like protein [Bryobacterales bacterium]|nr:Phosphatidylserine/phosphatidylglycerophosphate/ cardiolipin synthase-like protein [Bryobacterales bacterium]
MPASGYTPAPSFGIASLSFWEAKSLRAAELDARREVGVIIEDDAVATEISHTFERDWENAMESKDEARQDDTQSLKMARKVAKAMIKELPPVRKVIQAISGTRV